MDYEEKYNEALERAKRWADGTLMPPDESAKTIAEIIFPELRESEDERIRKELKEAFEAYDIESRWNGIPIRSIFAWLEKQKEPELIPDSVKYDEGFKDGRAIGFKEGVESVKPAEWSEEDENALKYIHNLISWGYAEKFMDAQTAHDMRKWLNEHLCTDTFQNGNSHWKPSEEQMVAFKKYIEEFQSRAEAAVGGWNNFDVMIRLYEQLKKLM